MKRLLVVALLSSSACYVEPANPPPAMGPPPQGGFGPQGGPPPGGGGMVAGGVIEAGCSYNGTQLPGDVGAAFDVSCPPGCDASGGLWGSDVYTADSGICRAAIHAGLISPGGGVVAVRLEPGRPAYRGSFRNGVQSSDYGQYPKSYVLGPSAQAAAAPPPPAPPPPAQYPPPPAYAQPQPASPPPPVYAQPRPAGYPAPPPPPPPMQAIEAGCSFNATQIRGQIGSSHLVNCPPGCTGGGSVWGTDVYTGDTVICRAAIHAGLLTEAGGNVVVTIEPGRPAYRGSARNRIRSNDYGNYPKSFHLTRP